MPDDLDEQIRAAMKTLDEQVPSGYFEALPNQILARLEDGSMQQGTGTSNVMNKPKMPDALMGAPVAPQAETAAKAKADERSEDSGLHDIRNLAQSTKQRMSKARITQNPPIADDVLASSSGQWKHVALPEPAKMVSLPDIASLPSKAEIHAMEKAEAKRLAEETKAKARAKKDSKGFVPPAPSSDEVLAPVATANAALDAMSAKPASITDIGTRQAFSLPSQQNKRSKGPLIAVLGLGVAAAAGGLIYMQMNNKGESKTAASSVAATETVAKAEVPKAPEPTPPPAAVAPEAAAAGSAAEAEAPPVEEPKAEEAVVASADTKSDKSDKKAAKRGAKGKKVEKDEAPAKEEVKVVEEKKAPEKPEPKKGGKGEEQAEESFDALLKEAGVDDKKKDDKPKLEKKSLSADDFKHGMAGIAGKAQGCYKGNQGTAMVKLTVGPAGKVTKVTVSGQFAGTPEGNCVESAVKSASFPPWDGGPQSFTYSYMLAD